MFRLKYPNAHLRPVIKHEERTAPKYRSVSIKVQGENGSVLQCTYLCGTMKNGWWACKQVRDMTAFVIHYCIVAHIKIAIQSLYCNPLPYCEHNTDSPFLF